MSDFLFGDAVFARFGSSHWLGLILVSVAAIWLVWVGRKIRGASRERAFRRAFAAIIVAIIGVFQADSLRPSRFGLESSLPLELCDLAWMASAYVLWTRHEWAYGPVYYWGLTLASQSLLTPDLEQDFPDRQFLMFWIEHSLIVLAAVFLTWGLGLRPTWRHYWRTVAATIAWGFAMLVFNTLTGANYLYVSRKPPAGSALDLFGPWPFYLAAEVAVGMSVWALMTAPWTWSQDARAAYHANSPRHK